MDKQSFLGILKALELPTVSKGHRYSTLEQALSYYVARNDLKKDDIDLLIIKHNRIKSTNLTLSSFGMMVSNMRYIIYGKGSSRISEQGLGVAKYLNKEYVNSRLDNLRLKNLLNEVYEENIL